MRLKFIEYIINAACVVNADATPAETDRSFITGVFSDSTAKNVANWNACARRGVIRWIMSYYSRFGNDRRAPKHYGWQNNVNRKRGGEYRRLSNATRKMLNGKKLSRDGKANFLISGDAFLPTNWWNRLEKGTGPLVSVIYLSSPPSPSPALLRNIPPTPSCNLAPSKRATFPSVALAVSL